MTCCTMSGGILRDLQQEINEINILLTNENLTDTEREFLKGKSCGLFVAMELISQYDPI